MRYLILLVLVLPACQTPTHRWAAARETLTTTTKALTFMAEQKILDDEQIVEVDKAVKTARAGIAEMEKQLPDGGSSFESMLDVVQAMLMKLATIEAQAKERAKKPAPPMALNTEIRHGPVDNYRGYHGSPFAHRGRDQSRADAARGRPAFARAA